MTLNKQYYHLSENGDTRYLTLSKTSLGDFCYNVMIRGGEIIQLWAFNHRYPRSSVFPVVKMTPQMKDDFVTSTGFKLVDPPKVSVC